jgi:hypothetical protein
MDPRVSTAAQNNAHWCDVVCRSHQLPTKLTERLWIAPEGSPHLYPDAVTLAPHLPTEVVLADIDTSAGCSVKDSFADLDLGGHGFVELFEATWLAREHAPQQALPRLSWRVVTTEDELNRWASAADLEDLFGPALLADPAIRFLGVDDGQRGRGGTILNRTGETVGISNVFATGLPPHALWSDLPAAVGSLFARLPMVGYEHGEDLAHAMAGSFEAIAPLQIWLKP